MKRGRDNKPDPLRDSSAAIMEGLTAGVIKGNAAGLAGELKELEEVTEICGLRFDGYLAKIETPRPRGALDEVMVAFTKAALDRGKTEDGLCIENNLKVGSKVLVSGKAQALKGFEGGKEQAFILADFVGMVKNPMMQDDVALRGVIARKPIYRRAPRGKRIADISVAVRNELTGGECLIPCVCWQGQADEAAGWRRGDTVELLGRFQSRHEKIADADSGSGEKRAAYEVSARTIRRKGRAGE